MTVLVGVTWSERSYNLCGEYESEVFSITDDVYSIRHTMQPGLLG